MLLMQLNIFLIIFTLLIIKPVVNARFLSVIGIDKLPFVFVLVAICAMVVSTLYSREIRRSSLQKATARTFYIAIFGLISIGILLNLHIAENLVLYVFYVGVAIFGVLATSQFWILANLTFDAREAKRFFGFIGAGAIAGGVAGGYVTSITSEFISSTNLLFFAALLLSICVPLNRIIWRKTIQNLTPFQQEKRWSGFSDHPFWSIKKSKHLTYLALLVAMGVVVSKLIEFQFSSVAVATIQDPDELTGFFGFWFSTFNVVSLLLQLFVTRKIVGTYGVGASLFALPGGILLGSVLLLIAPVLWAGIFTKLWEVSVKQSINKSATELLALPIPAGIKSDTKSFIDVFVDLAATGVAGLLLIFLINGLDLSIRAVSVLTIIILVFWIIVAIRVRREYIISFKSILTKADKRAIKVVPDLKNAGVLSSMKKSLEEGTENQILFLLDQVKEIQDSRFFETVARHLTHASSKVRLKALETIYFLQHSVQKEVLNQLLVDPVQEVRYRAFAQLLRQDPSQRISNIHNYLSNEDQMVSGAALVGISEEARNNPEMKKLLKLEQHISDKINYLNLTTDEEERYHYKVMILKAAGHSNFPKFYRFIDDSLEDENSEIVTEAIKSAGYTMSFYFIDKLTDFLIPKQYRPAAQKALLNFGPGIIPQLAEIATDPNSSPDLIKQIPALLEKMDSQKAVKVLYSFLDTSDVMLRLETLRSLNTLQRDFPHLKIRKDEIVQYILNESKMYKSILAALYKQNALFENPEKEEIHLAREKLINLLERRLDGTLERIFRLIGLRYPPEDVIPVYNGIRSINQDVRINSVEFLDNLLEPSLKKALIPIAETALFANISDETIQSLKVVIPTERECFSLLLEGRDVRLKVVLFQLLEKLNDPQYLDLIQPLLNSPVEKVQELAEKLVFSLKGKS